MLCSNGINHLILFCLESFATLTVLQSKSTGNDCNLFCAWFWMSHLLLPHNTVAEILLQHNTPRSHTSFKTQGAIKKLGCSSPSTLQPRSCSLRLPHLWSSQRWLPLEKVLGMLMRLLKQWLQVQDSKWYKKGKDALFFLLVQGC